MSGETKRVGGLSGAAAPQAAAARQPMVEFPATTASEFTAESSPLTGGSMYPLGDLPSGYTAQSIRYYKLGFSPTRISGGGTANGLYPFFDSAVSWHYTGRNNLNTFIADLVAGNPLGVPTVMDLTVAPSIYLNWKSYVVIDLVETIEWNFCENDKAVTVGISSLSSKYFGLLHYAPASTQGMPNAPGSCKRISFATGMPLTSGSDRFNLNLQFDQTLGTIPVIIDPEIKNRGGPPGN